MRHHSGVTEVVGHHDGRIKRLVVENDHALYQALLWRKNCSALQVLVLNVAFVRYACIRLGRHDTISFPEPTQEQVLDHPRLAAVDDVLQQRAAGPGHGYIFVHEPQVQQKVQCQHSISSRVAYESAQALSTLRPEALDLLWIHIVLLHPKKLCSSIFQGVLLEAVGGADDWQQIHDHPTGDGNVCPVYDLSHIPGAALSAHAHICMKLPGPLRKIGKIELIGVVTSQNIRIIISQYGGELS
ncbi:MAG: hypothetical protein A4E46_01373 [Methanosaeta sp. PtaU1.Bin016]|nr:MAG: hypothetical protein A4E46_01373 [Methanosaeta sp. PtaU1.Bin016]